MSMSVPDPVFAEECTLSIGRLISQLAMATDPADVLFGIGQGALMMMKSAMAHPEWAQALIAACVPDGGFLTEYNTRAIEKIVQTFPVEVTS